MHSPTPNYGLVRPEPIDPMNVPDVQINPNWDALAGVPAPNSGTTLPQSGSYNLGDRFYKSDTQSIYVLICKDVNWGWYWRPVHDAISPWFTVPTTCLQIAGWTLNPVVTNPFAIALDARGRCYWRELLDQLQEILCETPLLVSSKPCQVVFVPHDPELGCSDMNPSPSEPTETT